MRRGRLSSQFLSLFPALAHATVWAGLKSRLAKGGDWFRELRGGGLGIA